MAYYWLGIAIAIATAVVVIVEGGEGNVTYDGRSLIIDGQRKLLFSGSIHYPRSTPDVSLLNLIFSPYIFSKFILIN